MRGWKSLQSTLASAGHFQSMGDGGGGDGEGGGGEGEGGGGEGEGGGGDGKGVGGGGGDEGDGDGGGGEGAGGSGVSGNGGGGEGGGSGVSGDGGGGEGGGSGEESGSVEASSTGSHCGGQAMPSCFFCLCMPLSYSPPCCWSLGGAGDHGEVAAPRHSTQKAASHLSRLG